MFPGHSFEGITNGVHLPRWAAPATAACLDKYLPKWRTEPSVMEEAATKIPVKALQTMRHDNKARLLNWVNDNSNFFHFGDDLKKSDLLDMDRLTIVFARRFVPYKRPLLLFRDLERLQKIGHKKIQVVFAGHCHPDDYFCTNKKESLRNYAQAMRGSVKIAVIPDYNIDIADKLVSGANIWLNNPIPPREASGTSGMKAALNGALNLSVLDGWWIEGLKRKKRSGWGFGAEMNPDWSDDERDDFHANELYECLEKAVDLYTKRPDEWLENVGQAMTLAGHFNTHRVIEEYDEKMWSE
jgi:starch phosphorylase